MYLPSKYEARETICFIIKQNREEHVVLVQPSPNSKMPCLLRRTRRVYASTIVRRVCHCENGTADLSEII